MSVAHDERTHLYSLRIREGFLSETRSRRREGRDLLVRLLGVGLA